MNAQDNEPELYWVAGNGTDVGKTTIACAAIRVLNAQGKRSVGFKPFGASLLHNIVDFIIEKYPNAPCKLFGGDAWKLTMASPWTDIDSIDLVSPIQTLCYSDWKTIILVRTGARLLGNVEYFCSEYGHSLKDRPDFRRLIDYTGLPMDDAVVVEDLDRDTTAAMAPEKQKHAFGKLLDLGVDAVVCEGAGRWISTWPDCPPANHLLFVADGNVTLIPNLNWTLPAQNGSALLCMREFKDFFTSPERQSYSIPLFIAETERRDEVAEQTVGDLLTEAKLI